MRSAFLNSFAAGCVLSKIDVLIPLVCCWFFFIPYLLAVGTYVYIASESLFLRKKVIWLCPPMEVRGTWEDSDATSKIGSERVNAYFVTVWVPFSIFSPKVVNRSSSRCHSLIPIVLAEKCKNTIPLTQ